MLFMNRDQPIAVVEAAKVQSTKASNAGENIRAPDKRIADLVRQKTEPKNRSEQEIPGCRDVLNTIYQSYDHIAVSHNVILKLHRDLYAYTGQGTAHFRKSE